MALDVSGSWPFVPEPGRDASCFLQGQFEDLRVKKDHLISNLSSLPGCLLLSIGSFPARFPQASTFSLKTCDIIRNGREYGKGIVKSQIHVSRNLKCNQRGKPAGSPINRSCINIFTQPHLTLSPSLVPAKFPDNTGKIAVVGLPLPIPPWPLGGF